jgi:pseudaminic acid synthase
MSEITIAGRKIGLNHPPFIIAEMSGNHNQSLERALEIVTAAAEAGADAIKIQTYTADTMTLDISEGEFFIEDKNSLWKGKSLYQLYEEAHTPWEWHKEIFKHATKLGIIAFSSPFDATAVDFLETLNAPCYKIASFENTDIPLIKKVAKTGKPMIISTGMASTEEIEESVAAAREAGCKDLILLKCTSTYPASASNSNIITIPDIKERFGVEAGLSDHTLGIGVAVASVVLGARVIEKHFTLNRADGGVDSTFSLEPAELKALKLETTRAWEGLGNISYGTSDAESGSKVFRRSLYIVNDIKKGEKFTPENIRAIRPGFGLAPKHYDNVMGKVANQDLKRGTPLKSEHF